MDTMFFSSLFFSLQMALKGDSMRDTQRRINNNKNNNTTQRELKLKQKQKKMKAINYIHQFYS